MSLYFNWLTDPSAPAWLQAVGSIVAIFVAVLIPWRQRRNVLRDAAADRTRQEREHLRSLTAGLREEIRAASNAAARRQYAISHTFTELEKALTEGKGVKISGPIEPGSLSFTDAIIYRQIGAQLGTLPKEIVSGVVAFYSLIIDLGRLADGAPTAVEAYQDIFPSLPRIRTHAAILVRTLDKFEAAGFTREADIHPVPAEIRQFAADAGYPIDEIAKDMGVELPT